MHCTKLLVRARWQVILWAVTQLWPREKKGVCVFCLRILIYAKLGEKIWVSLPEMVSTASCTFVGRRRREIQRVSVMVPEPQSPHPRVPFHSLSRPPATFCTPSRTKESAGPHWLGVCLFQSHFSQLLFDTFALFSEVSEVSHNNSLTAIDHIFQTKNWNM